jgi:adenine deaminase
MTQDLVAVAMGRKHADTVICNGRWVNVHSGEILPGTDVAIVGGRIAYVGPDASHCIGPQTRIIEAKQRYLVPGLCDAHMHVESGMVTVTEFARAVIPHGTTSMFIDPHEIANVLGLPGVRLMHDEALTMPINVYVQMPSCVPSAPGLETPGASIGPDEVAEAMTWPGIIGLGEMMNFPGVFKRRRQDARRDGGHACARARSSAATTPRPTSAAPSTATWPAARPTTTRARGWKTPSPACGRACGPCCASARPGTTWRAGEGHHRHGAGQPQLHPLHRRLPLRHAGGRGAHGPRRAPRHRPGLRPITAIQMATLNTAQHFGLEREIGSITPGRYADIVITSDLAALPIEMVIARGEVVAENGRIAMTSRPTAYPDFAVGHGEVGEAAGGGRFRCDLDR